MNHGAGIAGSLPLYYPIQPSILFHHFGFSQLNSRFGLGSPLTILAPPCQLSTIVEQNTQQQEQSMLSVENSLPPHHLEPPPETVPVDISNLITGMLWNADSIYSQ